MTVTGSTDKQPLSICGEGDGGHERGSRRVRNFVQGKVVEVDVEEGFFVKVFRIVEIDPLVDVEADSKDDTIGVVGNNGRSW